MSRVPRRFKTGRIDGRKPDPPDFPMRISIVLLVLAACTLAGCKTQSAMTAKATGCGTMSVDVLKSRYSREGSTTIWCAKCKNTIYLCATNPEHSRVECKEAGPDICP